MTRDFSINCLFFDPFKCKIYDYVDALKDLKSYTVRTVIPPHLSFKVDCARILRGLRIAARLGLRFSKNTEAAILDLSSSIQSLCKDRLMMEMNYMMAHGAAASSINLLQKFKLLESLFPAHAAYLSAQSIKLSSQQSVMLMKLLVNADNLLRADHPCCCNLWLGLLAFHLALVDNPQDALVIWTFSSILYHGTWNEAVEFVKRSSNSLNQFVPELTQASRTMPDDLLFRKTSRFVSLAKSAVKVLTDTEALQQSLDKYGSSSRCSVFVPQKTGKKICELFDVMNVCGDHGDKRAQRRRINYELLKKGDLNETRFVLGKIIMDTMKGGLISEPDHSFAAPELNNKRTQLSRLF